MYSLQCTVVHLNCGAWFNTCFGASPCSYLNIPNIIEYIRSYVSLVVTWHTWVTIPSLTPHPSSEVVLQELSDEQKQQIMTSQDFRSFFDSAARIVEKALCEEIDVGFLYSGEGLLDRWLLYQTILFSSTSTILNSLSYYIDPVGKLFKEVTHNNLYKLHCRPQCKYMYCNWFK